MSYSDETIFREIILDHVKNPRNTSKPHNNYVQKTLKNPSCGDMITVYVKEKNGIIEDICYDATGCSISISSSSIMSDLLIGKTKKEAEEIIENFNNMITGKPYNKELLGESIALKGIVNVPPRIKCATLGYKALSEALDLKVGDYVERP